MESKASFCFVDIGPLTTTVTTSFPADARKWQMETPAQVAAAATHMHSCLHASGATSAIDAHLACVAKASHLTTVDHVLFLTRSQCTQELFALYVLRWLHAACPTTTAVSAMPLAIYAILQAGVSSALVVDGTGGVLTCTPVLDGVVAAEGSVHWADVRAYAKDVTQTLPQCWREAATAVMTALTAAPQLGECDGESSSPVLSCATAQSTTAEAAWFDEVPFACEVRQHLQLCRQRELDACLSTVLLFGEAATVVEARYCVCLVLSLLLPDSVVTWC